MSSFALKQTLRTHFREARHALSAETRQQHSQQIADHLQTCAAINHAKHIGVYLSVDSEVETKQIINNLWAANKTVALPVISTNKQIEFVRYNANDSLVANQFSILEPTSHTKSHAQNRLTCDCLLIPMVAFNKEGYRLGFGGGYYDKYIHSVTKTPICIGLAYEIQQTNKIFHESWDKKMHFVVTEEKIYDCCR